jgi:zinc and cadmium transporter
MRIWAYVALAVLLDGLAGLVGALIPEGRVRTQQPALLGFAAGVLIAVVFVDLLPEALAETRVEVVMVIVLASFASMVMLEWLIARWTAPKSARGTLLLGSDALHNVGDGAAIAAAFLSSPRVGMMAALAVIVHEVPEEVGAYALLRSGGMRRGPALRRLAGVQLTAALGAAATLAGTRVWATLSGVVLALAGGTFLHIGAADLLPEVLRSGTARAQARAVLGFLVGLGIAVLASLVF